MTIYQALALAALGYLIGTAADNYEAMHPYTPPGLVNALAGAIGWTLLWASPVLVLVGVAA